MGKNAEALWLELVSGAIDRTLERYSQPPESAYAEYPYPEWKKELSNEPVLLGRDLLFWFTAERVRPETGKTLLEEFAESKTSDPDALAMARGVRHVIKSDFTVLSRRGKMLLLRDMEGNRYNARLGGGNENYERGTIVTARIYKWGDVYRFCSISLIKQMPPELRALNLGMLGIIDRTRRRRRDHLEMPKG